MKAIYADLIMSFEPCGDWPRERVEAALPELMSVPDFLRAAHISAEDKIWVVLRNEILAGPELRLFAVLCAESVIGLSSPHQKLARTVIRAARRYMACDATTYDRSKAVSSLLRKMTGQSADPRRMTSASVTGIEVPPIKMTTSARHALDCAAHCASPFDASSAIRASSAAAMARSTDVYRGGMTWFGREMGAAYEEEKDRQCDALAEMLEDSNVQ